MTRLRFTGILVIVFSTTFMIAMRMEDRDLGDFVINLGQVIIGFFSVARFRDTGNSPWWAVTMIFGFAGSLAAIYCMIAPSKRAGESAIGPALKSKILEASSGPQWNEKKATTAAAGG